MKKTLLLAITAALVSACGELHGGGAGTMAPTPASDIFTNPNITGGMASGGELVSPAAQDTAPVISSAQAEQIALHDRGISALGAGQPVEAVLVQLTFRHASGSPAAFPSGYPQPSATPYNSYYDKSPCLCWVVDLTPPKPPLDAVHNKYPVKYVVCVVDARTGDVRADEQG